MFKAFAKVKKLLELGKWVLLFVDTLQYFHDEAEKRGLSGSPVKLLKDEL